VETIYPIGFVGLDGEGYELWHALEKCAGVQLRHFIQTAQRRTFTYCKPLVVRPNSPPVELNRLDLKNWQPSPALLQDLLVNRLKSVAQELDALIVLDQVDVPETGAVTGKVREALRGLAEELPELLILADSRRGLRGFPPVTYKMNAAELAALTGTETEPSLEHAREAAAGLARQNQRSVFVTLAERGLLGAAADSQAEHVPALPVRGPIDIVGAGDAVTANLAVALAAGANLRESLEIANAAASVVIHQLGTTGTAGVPHIRELLVPPAH
jgi:bifunctional ADP-heptose synthase (sugar kinase/adenylyltransferase)